MVSTLWVVLSIKVRFGTGYIFAFANVAAAFSVVFSKLFWMKLVIYSYEPHSDFMVDLGLWHPSSLKYKILSALERWAGRAAAHVMTGTKYGLELLENIQSKAQTYRAPTAVDGNDFYFRPEARVTVREQLGIQEQSVFLYIGKFGDLYFKEEVIDVFKSVFQNDPYAFFIVITTYDHAEIWSWFESRNIPERNYFLTQNITNEEVKAYISAADMGISAVPPSPAQRYRSPTKVAEYLLCGLPYITCEGVSEDDEYADKEAIGVVLSDFTQAEVLNKWKAIERLLSEDKDQQRARCRRIGLAYRSKEKIDMILESVFRLDQ